MATQQYREVKRKAAVGERIKIVAASYTMGRYDNGDEFTVNHVDRDDDVYVSIDGKDRLICLSEFVVLEPIAQPSAPSPLSADPLYAAFLQFVADNTTEIRAILPQVEGLYSPKEPQLSVEPPFRVAPIKFTRAEVIAKATADVAELLARNYPLGEGYSPSAYFSQKDGYAVTDECKFVVNREKRTVVALISVIGSTRIDRKGTAKCSPADVFHADLGKAIALRKALGLAVPTEYTDAPQPDGRYANMIVRYERKTRKLVPSNLAVIHGETAHTGSIIGKRGVILDDTYVDYSAVSAKGVAA
ncbi:hypothetical protein MHB77_32410 [Paenibacillus sp. FSL K6-3166]|uniref:hypothetical protein n=1 Tax=unclassified Paenibacillus TaxID=185978 RepID=UPI000BA0B3CE|nr:hypothetical protein [Paenibacillus sp. VTT E-133291]OZQ84695.1 hypothetical protein CA598_23155 [Paenibacillus sp. VTT E-133291]